MKKLFLSMVVTVLLLGVSESWGQSIWYKANQKQLSWDAVTTLEDGRIVSLGDVIQYQVYRCLLSDVNKQNPVKIGITSDTTYLLTFTDEGKFILGVEAVRMQGLEVISNSKVSWSDNPDVVLNGNTFGVMFFAGPKSVGGLKIPTSE